MLKLMLDDRCDASPLKVNFAHQKKKNKGLKMQLMSMRRRETLFMIDDLSHDIQFIQLLNTDQYAYTICSDQDCADFHEIPDRIKFKGRRNPKVCKLQE